MLKKKIQVQFSILCTLIFLVLAVNVMISMNGVAINSKIKYLYLIICTQLLCLMLTIILDQLKFIPFHFKINKNIVHMSQKQ